MDIGPIFRALLRHRTRFVLISLEVAFTFAIVANCVALVTDAKRRMGQASGFDDDNIVRVEAQLTDPSFAEQGRRDNVVEADLAALAAIPGVRAVTNTRFLPWRGGGSSTEMRALGEGEMLRTQIYNADENTLDALGVPVTAGRNLTREEVLRDTRRLRDLTAVERERDASGKVTERFQQDVIVSRAFGELVFGEGDPLLGRLLEDNDGDTYQIVGVIDQFYNPYGWPIHHNVVFYATRANSFSGGMPYLVRTEPGHAAEVAAAIDAALLAVDPGRQMRVETLTEVKAGYFGPQQIVASLMSGVAVLLVMVTGLGIVGLTSFSVTERTRQIGTRRALGARRVDVLRHFLVENGLVTGVGLAAGLVLAVGLNVGLTQGMTTARLGPAIALGGVVTMVLVGAGATLVPALRASRISPAIATRNV